MAFPHMRFAAALRFGGVAFTAAAVGACSGNRGDGAGSGSGSASAAAPATDAAPAIPDPALRPLGAASPEEADFRHGPGADAYARALAAEKQGDWPAVVAACRAARGADAHHIDAAWLEAAALAREGKLAEMIEPLGVAAAGDWGKWGERSLVLPLYADFLASPYGAAWQRAAAKYRDAYAAALARAIPVIARRASGASRQRASEPGPADLFAFDPVDKRWLRLTRGGGAVVAVLDAPGAPFVAYVSFRDVRAGRAVERRLRVGVVDRATGKAGREVELPDAATLSVAWRASRTGEPSLELETAAPHALALDWRIDWRRGAKTKIKGPIPSRGVIVTAHGARRVRLPVTDVTADWDGGTASAFRVDTSNKTIEPTGASLVDGDTIVWSPDRARLAFATAPDEPCAPTTVAKMFAVDAASGVVHALGDADDPGQLRWLDADHLAYVTGGAIRVVDVPHDAESARIAGGAGLALDGWLVRHGCDHGDVEAVFAPEPDPGEPEPDPGEPEPDSAAPGDAGPHAPPSRDAGVVDAAPAADARSSKP